MKTRYKVCQSCGMPLPKEGTFNGTEANGTVNAKFCSFCYQKGKFTHSNISVNEMKCLVAQNENYPKLLKWFYSSKLPKLERWDHSREPELLSIF